MSGHFGKSLILPSCFLQDTMDLKFSLCIAGSGKCQVNTHFYETHISSWQHFPLPCNPAPLRGRTEDALIKTLSPCMCLAGQCLLRLLIDAPQCFTSGLALT